MGDFVKGIQYFFQGFVVLKELKLKRYIWIPLLLNIVVFSSLLILSGFWLNNFAQWLSDFLPHWLDWLRWLMWLLMMLVSVVIWAFISTWIANIVAAPFNALLTHKLLLRLPAKTQPVVSTQSFLKSIPSAIVRQLQILVYYLPRALLCLLFFIIPVVQIFAALIWFVFNAWTIAFQYIDYPMDNNGINIEQMKIWMKKKPALNLGFGLCVLLVTMIPIINFFVMPLAVAGASVMWSNEYFVT